MSAYKVGAVNVTVGSQSVVGVVTEFNTYVDAGDLFRITGENVFYQVASVNSATRLTLSGRYSSTSDETNRANEYVASTNAASLAYNMTLDYTPVIQNSVNISASNEVFTDDGAGTLTGDGGGSGTVSYDDGSVAITLNATAGMSADFVASYHSGDALNSMNYQIVVDYTTNYNLPETSNVDRNIAQIVTRGFRLIDDNLFEHRCASITASQDIEVTATNTYGLVLRSQDNTRWRITVSNTGTIVAASI